MSLEPLLPVSVEDPPVEPELPEEEPPVEDPPVVPVPVSVDDPPIEPLEPEEPELPEDPFGITSICVTRMESPEPEKLART